MQRGHSKRLRRAAGQSTQQRTDLKMFLNMVAGLSLEPAAVVVAETACWSTWTRAWLVAARAGGTGGCSAGAPSTTEAGPLQQRGVGTGRRPN